MLSCLRRPLERSPDHRYIASQTLFRNADSLDYAAFEKILRSEPPVTSGPRGNLQILFQQQRAELLLVEVLCTKTLLVIL